MATFTINTRKHGQATFFVRDSATAGDYGYVYLESAGCLAARRAPPQWPAVKQSLTAGDLSSCARSCRRFPLAAPSPGGAIFLKNIK